MIVIILTFSYLQSLQSHSKLTLAKQRQLHNNWQGLLKRNAGCYMLVGKAGPTWNHWIAHTAWTGVLYDGGGVVRIIEDADCDSQASAKAVFTDELQLDDLREVYVVKMHCSQDKKKKARNRGRQIPFYYKKTEQDKNFQHGVITWAKTKETDWAFRSALVFGEIFLWY